MEIAGYEVPKLLIGILAIVLLAGANYATHDVVTDKLGQAWDNWGSPAQAPSVTVPVTVNTGNNTGKPAPEVANNDQPKKVTNSWENVPITLVTNHMISEWTDTYRLPTTLWWGNARFVLQGQRTDVRGTPTYSDFSSLFGTMIANGMSTGDSLSVYLPPRIDNALSSKRLLAWRKVLDDGSSADEWIVRLISDNQPSKEFWHITASMGSVPSESEGKTLDEVTTAPTTNSYLTSDTGSPRTGASYQNAGSSTTIPPAATYTGRTFGK